MAEGTPRFERLPEQVDEEEVMREVRQAERRAVEAALQSNATRRAMELKALQEEGFAIAARKEGAPPASGSDGLLTSTHREPPFDPAVRRELRRDPPEARGLVARQDSVLFDHVGSRNRVDESSGRAEAAITRQRELGRRRFEIRQQRGADVTQQREAAAEQRRIEEYQRLEASQVVELANRIESRRQVIFQNAAGRESARDVARASIASSVQTRSARARELVVNARQQNIETHNTASNERSQAVTARQREVFQLQVEVANTRKERTQNPPERTGNEAQQLVARARTGIQRFQQLQIDKQAVMGRLEQGRVADVARKDSSAREGDSGRLEKATERSQNIRRRLTSTYGGESVKSSGQRIGRPV